MFNTTFSHTSLLQKAAMQLPTKDLTDLSVKDNPAEETKQLLPLINREILKRQQNEKINIINTSFFRRDNPPPHIINILDFFRKLPKSETILKEKNIPGIEFGLRIFNQERFDQYFQSLTEDELEIAFFEAVNANFHLFTNMIIERIYRINFYGLGAALCAAAENGSLDSVQALMKHRLFATILSSGGNGKYGLGAALCAAAKNGHLDIVQALMQNQRFNTIEENGEYGLGAALCTATKNGHLDIVQALMQNQRFATMRDASIFEISSYLNEALLCAIKNDHVDIAQAILENAGFLAIIFNNREILKHILYQAIYRNNLELVNKILQNTRFQNIDSIGFYGLQASFYTAAENGNFDIVNAIMLGPRFKDIPNNCEWNLGDSFGLGSALCIAAEKGHLNIVQLIMQNQRFSKINANGYQGLGAALYAAAKNGHFNIMQTIMQNYRFREIFFKGPNGLLESLNKSIENAFLSNEDKIEFKKITKLMLNNSIYLLHYLLTKTINHFL